MKESTPERIKKPRSCGFDNVKDPALKDQIMKLTKAPQDASNFIFWHSKTNPEDWGLTLKSIPKKGEKEGFPSQHTWKITWVNKEIDGKKTLCVANHCKYLASNIQGNEYEKIKEFYNNYKK
jgi:hypothetical protein